MLSMLGIGDSELKKTDPVLEGSQASGGDTQVGTRTIVTGTMRGIMGAYTKNTLRLGGGDERRGGQGRLPRKAII